MLFFCASTTAIWACDANSARLADSSLALALSDALTALSSSALVAKPLACSVLARSSASPACRTETSASAICDCVCAMLASAWARLASFWASCVSSVERSSTARTSPFFTTSPWSALSWLTIMPLRSVPALASSRATMVPLTDSFSTMSRVSAATTRMAGGVGALAGAASSAATPGAIAMVGSATEASSAVIRKARDDFFNMHFTLSERVVSRRWICWSGAAFPRARRAPGFRACRTTRPATAGR